VFPRGRFRGFDRRQRWRALAIPTATQIFGGGRRPRTLSALKPSASNSRSVPDGPSNSNDTGNPAEVSPAGSTTPGSPAVLPGAMLRDIAAANETFCPPMITSFWPITAAVVIVVGNTIAATPVRAK
jgi:hypothetical protein